MKLAPKAAVLLAGLAASGMAFAQSNLLPENQPMDVNGVQAVCTGTTSDVRMDPQWQSYSLRLEFAGKGGQYLGDETVNVQTCISQRPLGNRGPNRNSFNRSGINLNVIRETWMLGSMSPAG